MKITRANTIVAGIALGALIAGSTPGAYAASAQVSEVVKQVSVGSRPASVGDTVSGNTSLKTGTKSRAELTFKDETLLRIGSNTIFAFNRAGRAGKNFTLTHGTALVSAPDKHNGVRVNCGGVTAAVTGSLSTIVNTAVGVAFFAALGNNSFIFPNGDVISVPPFNFGWLKKEFDADGNLLPFTAADVVLIPYDADTQLNTSLLGQDLPPSVLDRLEQEKVRQYRAGLLQDQPGTEDQNRDPNAGPQDRRDTEQCVDISRMSFPNGKGNEKKKKGFLGRLFGGKNKGNKAEIIIIENGKGDPAESFSICREVGSHTPEYCEFVYPSARNETGADCVCPEGYRMVPADYLERGVSGDYICIPDYRD